MSTDTITDLLLLSRLDEVEAIAVGAGDQSNGMVPDWCEIVLDVTGEDGGRSRRLHLTRHDSELIIEVLHTVLHPAGRKTVVARLWEELDDVMEFLMGVDDPEEEDRVRAKTLAKTLAMLTQPYSEEPDLGAIRAQAVARWEAAQ